MMSNFWQLATTPILKIQYFLWVCWFLGKNLSKFVSPLENSTTRITITEDAESSDTNPSPKILLQKAPTDKGIQYLG